MRVPLLFAFACFASLSCVKEQTQAASKAASNTVPSEQGGLKISVAPTFKNHRGDSIELRPGTPYIDVVLQNTSSKPLNIFEEWNSWGARNLTLKITKMNGKVLHDPLIVANIQTAWYRNFPSFETIQPGETIVRQTHLQVPNQGLSSVGLYGKFPFPPKGHPSQITMSAVFANDNPNGNGNKGLKKKVVWTGYIASSPTNYRIYWGTDAR